MQIKTRFFELIIYTRREWTRRMIQEYGHVKAIKMYMDRYKCGLKAAHQYVSATWEEMQR